MLPLRKPVHASLLELLRQLRRGTYDGRDVLRSGRESPAPRAAVLLGAGYRELALPGSHVWMLDRPAALVSVLAGGEPELSRLACGSGPRPRGRRTPRGAAP